MTKKKENKINSLYVHVPFCEHICAYCDFPKLIKNSKFIEPYLKALLHELDSKNIDKVKTIYIGGGTPTSLDINHLELLLSKLNKFLDKEYEFTIESNIESLSLNKINILKKYGINRISLGIQSFNNDVLTYLGRKHNKEQCINLVKLLKDNGFTNINCDLIYGTEISTLEQIKEDLDILLSLDITHISTYSLIIEPNTVLYNKGTKELDDNKLREQYDFILSYLNKYGFNRYEVSNFSKGNVYESKHNLTYWKNEQYYACGLGASGYENNIRYQNTKNINEYIKYNFIDSKEYVDLESDKQYFLITNLRLKEGFLLEDYQNRYNEKFLDIYKDKVNKLINDGLLMVENNSIFPTDDGIMLLDTILRTLI